MKLSNFRVYGFAVELYRSCESVRLPAELKKQLIRSSSSVVLNIAEGTGRMTPADRRRFFAIALGSLRETDAILDLSTKSQAQIKLIDAIGAMLYRLCHPR